MRVNFDQEIIKKIVQEALPGELTIQPAEEDFDQRLTVEGILIAVNKLSYIAKTMPERIPNHHAIPKLKQSISLST